MGVSVSDVLTYLGLPTDGSEDARVGDILAGIRAQVEQHVGTPLVRETKVEDFDAGDHVYYTYYRPIVSVTSIVDPAGNTLGSDDYVLQKEEGRLIFYSYIPRPVNSDGTLARWTITYVAGLFADEESIRPDIALAIRDLCAQHYHRPEPDVQAVRTLDQATSYIPNPNSTFVLPPRVQHLLAPYVRRSV